MGAALDIMRLLRFGHDKIPYGREDKSTVILDMVQMLPRCVDVFRGGWKCMQSRMGYPREHNPNALSPLGLRKPRINSDYLSLMGYQPTCPSSSLDLGWVVHSLLS